MARRIPPDREPGRPRLTMLWALLVAAAIVGLLIWVILNAGSAEDPADAPEAILTSLLESL